MNYLPECMLCHIMAATLGILCSFACGPRWPKTNHPPGKLDRKFLQAESWLPWLTFKFPHGAAWRIGADRKRQDSLVALGAEAGHPKPKRLGIQSLTLKPAGKNCFTTELDHNSQVTYDLSLPCRAMGLHVWPLRATGCWSTSQPGHDKYLLISQLPRRFRWALHAFFRFAPQST